MLLNECYLDMVGNDFEMYGVLVDILVWINVVDLLVGQDVFYDVMLIYFQ